MVTTVKRRIREAQETSGTLPGQRAAVRKYEKYGLNRRTLQVWIVNGDVTAFADGSIDEASLRKRLQNYQPHKDNQSRRMRTPPDEKAEAANGDRQSSNIPSHVGGRSGNGVVNGSGSVVMNGRAAARSSAPTGAVSGGIVVKAGTYASTLPEGVEPLLETADWTALYLREKGSKLTDKTRSNYDTAFGPFIRRFPTLRLGALVESRGMILKYVNNLEDQVRGGPLGDNAKKTYLKRIIAFLKWLGREWGYNIPDLTESGLEPILYYNLTILPGQTRLALRQCRNTSEANIITLLAQTGMRIGELCTVRPELVHDVYVEDWGSGAGRQLPAKYAEVWGKEGYRQVPLPDECYRLLMSHLDVYRQLVWADGRGRTYPLAGSIQQTDPRRPIDLNEPRSLTSPPKTFYVQPLTGGIEHVKRALTFIFKQAGIYRRGMGAHSFRRAYEDEFKANGGDRLFMDRILGHVNESDMTELYHHTTIARLCEQANQYAPRQFLNKEAPHGELALVGG